MPYVSSGSLRVDSKVASLSSVDSYIRRQATLTAAVNVVLNPLLAWLGNREMDFKQMWASDGLAIDLAATSIILSLLVALFTSRDLRAQLRSGRLSAGEFPRPARWLSMLPSRGSSLGLILGTGAAVVTLLASGLLDLAGASGMSAAAHLVVKAIYGGCLGYAVARWVIIRQLAAVPAQTPG